MNRKLATLILTVSATLGVSSLNAQEKAVADIPFAFHLGKETMPAGKYTIENPIRTDTSLFSVSAKNGDTRYVGARQQGQSDPSDAKLSFVRYKGEYTLMTIELPGSAVSHSIKLPASTTHDLGMASMVSVRLTR